MQSVLLDRDLFFHGDMKWVIHIIVLAYFPGTGSKEEELDSLARGRRAEAGFKRIGVARGKTARVPPADFCGRIRGGNAAPYRFLVVYAAFEAGFAVGCAAFLAFSFAANSCRTLRAMASVSTL